MFHESASSPANLPTETVDALSKARPEQLRIAARYAKALTEHKECEARLAESDNSDVDCIIVGRGGGSDTDLMAFNHEAVAEAIFTSNTPVVAAVGHAEGRTIAGRVADRNAITPTDAGEYVTTDVEQFLSGEVDGLEQGLEATYESFRREFEYEKELERAAAEAGGPGRDEAGLLQDNHRGPRRALAGCTRIVPIHVTLAKYAEITKKVERINTLIEQL